MAKILVIDDDLNIVQGLRIRLKSAGYEVLAATDGMKGLLMALELKPDLVIVDIMMPLGGGFSVAYRLREQALKVPVIFITASKKPELREMADKLGAVGFLEKPYENEELLSAVADALKGRPVSSVGSAAASKPEVPASAMAAAAGSGVSESGNVPGGFEAAAPEDGRTPVQSPSMVEPASVASPKSPATITGRKKLLIVEDDRRIMMALALRLQNAGHEVIQAFDAMSGVEAAIQHQPDLILMDINLPGGSGLIAAQRIQSVVSKLMPIIFLTASQQPELRQKALALGAAGFLQKPYDPRELLNTIQNALLAAGDKAPGSRPFAPPAPQPLKVEPPAPTTPEKALDFQLANLRMAAPSSNDPKSQPKLVRITGRNKILIVENDRRIAMDLTVQLQNAGQEVMQASHEMSGVEAAAKHQPDLILMDIDLPGGSGLLVAQRIQSAVSKLTPMIFLTTGKQPELRQKALALGTAGFLEKPCDPDVLLRTIQNVLSLGRGDDPATTVPGFFE